jgi:hypothetical protein
MAVGAFVEEAADVRGGFFKRGVSAAGTPQQRLKNNGRVVLHRILRRLPRAMPGGSVLN